MFARIALAALVISLPVLAAPSSPPSLLPAQMKSRYLSMNLAIGDETARFTLPYLEYQNLRLKKLDSQKLKGRFLTLVNAEIKKDKAGVDALVAPVKVKTNDPMFQHVFSGKGSPEQIGAVLKLAARLRTNLGADWKDKGDLGASLKAFYLAHIGLDCNGFAGNYARAIGSKYGPETSILAFAPASKRVKKVADVRPGDVMVWKDNKHITTIQGRRPDGLFDIVESNGDNTVKGLGTSVWELKETGGDLIKAIRHFDNGKKSGAATVYVAALK